VPAEELTSATRELANTISQKASAAVRTGKAMFYPQLDMELEKAYEYASEHMVNNLKDADTQRGLNAFINKKSRN